MTFLPIVQRELRVSARKRSTFWLRVVAALVGLVIGGGCLMIFSLDSSGTVALGQVMFSVLTWMALVAALASGLFFTSDCLSEEKREGTLGFLFLTDLKGYDVAGGKLVATSVRGSFAFLAVLPMLAATLLMGGVTGTEFWKTTLALINALVASLAAGLLVSSVSRDSHKAMGGTLLLLIAMMAGGPVLDSFLAQTRGTGYQPTFSLGSAAYAFVIAGAPGRNSFWQALFVSHGLAWAMIGLASVLVARAWQEKRRTAAAGGRQFRYSWKYGGPKQRARLRRRLMEIDPVMWLACRERWQPLGVWALVLLVVAIMTAIKLYRVSSEFWLVWKYVDWCLVLALYLGASSQASRFLVEARRSGMIELLLATPVNGTQIARGSWLAVVRMFAVPIGLLLVANLVANGFAYSSTWGGLSAMVSGRQPGLAAAAVATVFGCLTTAGNLVALVWFGMWMGMTSRNANLATLKTFLLVQVAPWLGISFLSMMGTWMLLIPGLGGLTRAGSGVPAIYAWYPVIMGAFACMLSLGKDLSFVLWAKSQLYTRFRERAAMIPGMSALPPLMIQRTAAAPPPIANAELRT